jgi:hypothetical protein
VRLGEPLIPTCVEKSSLSANSPLREKSFKVAFGQGAQLAKAIAIAKECLRFISGARVVDGIASIAALPLRPFLSDIAKYFISAKRTWKLVSFLAVQRTRFRSYRFLD